MAHAETPGRGVTGTNVGVTVALVVLAFAWLLLPHFGELGELVSIAAPLLFLGVIALHVITFGLGLGRRVIVAISALAWIVSGVVMIGSPRVPIHFAAPQHPVRIVAANLRFDNPTPVEAAGTVQARRADVAIVSESTRFTESILANAFPYWAASGHGGNNYVEFVGSRYPLRRLAVPAGLLQAVVVEVMAPTPFELVAVHLPRAGVNLPHLSGEVSFATQKRAIDTVIGIADTARLPVVVAGDFNVSDRTASYRRLVAHRRDAMRASWAATTYRAFPWNLLALRIDHVIIDRSWCAAHTAHFHPTGSDHNGVQVSIGPCP